MSNIIHHFLELNYPYPYSPALIEAETGIKANTISKSLGRLYKKGLIDKVPRLVGTYRAKPMPGNIQNLEDPPVKIHGLTVNYAISEEIIKRTKTPHTPPLLYTSEDNYNTLAEDQLKDGLRSGHFHIKDHIYIIKFQYNPESVTVHINASKRPLDELEFIAIKTWIIGYLAGQGVRVDLCQDRIVKAELNRDFELLTITPGMIEIRDLENKAWLRIYRKYRNLTRLEIGTTWEGDKEIYEHFTTFGNTKNKPDDKGARGMFQ